jgi:hypothetical protein
MIQGRQGLSDCDWWDHMQGGSNKCEVPSIINPASQPSPITRAPGDTVTSLSAVAMPAFMWFTLRPSSR